MRRYDHCALTRGLRGCSQATYICVIANTLQTARAVFRLEIAQKIETILYLPLRYIYIYLVVLRPTARHRFSSKQEGLGVVCLLSLLVLFD